MQKLVCEWTCLRKILHQFRLSNSQWEFPLLSRQWRAIGHISSNPIHLHSWMRLSKEALNCLKIAQYTFELFRVGTLYGKQKLISFISLSTQLILAVSRRSLMNFYWRDILQYICGIELLTNLSISWNNFKWAALCLNSSSKFIPGLIVWADPKHSELLPWVLYWWAELGVSWGWWCSLLMTTIFLHGLYFRNRIF